jgi:hypothetical protein
MRDLFADPGRPDGDPVQKPHCYAPACIYLSIGSQCPDSYQAAVRQPYQSVELSACSTATGECGRTLTIKDVE